MSKAAADALAAQRLFADRPDHGDGPAPHDRPETR
jgi:hypothetical protein